MTQFNANQFAASNNAQAAVGNADRLSGQWVTNRAVDSAIRSIVHEHLKQDASQTDIMLGAEEAKAVYDIVKQASASSVSRDSDPIGSRFSAQTNEGLPSNAQMLGEIAARAGRDAHYTGSVQDSLRLGDSLNARPTDYAIAVDLGGQKEPGVPNVQSVRVQLSADFSSTIRDLMKADAVDALAQNASLATKAAQAEDRAQDKFLTSKTSQVRHGGRFEGSTMRQVSQLDPAERARLALTRDLASLGAVFGFKDAGKSRPTLGQCGCF